MIALTSTLPTNDDDTTIEHGTTESFERSVLKQFFCTTGGPEWFRNRNWLSSNPTQSWEGVSCGVNDRVIGLQLNNNNLTGTNIFNFRPKDSNHIYLSGDVSKGILSFLTTTSEVTNSQFECMVPIVLSPIKS